jgi:hypothetical protein
VSNRLVVTATWDDACHLTEEAKARTLASIPPYLRDARSKGIPQLGAGAIYPVPESELRVPNFPIPKHWKRGYGLDAGGGAKPTAVVFGALDVENDVLYVTDVYKRKGVEIAVHLAAILARGTWLPGVGDCAALIVTAYDAEQLIKVYRRGGMKITLADKAVESGISETWVRMSTGRCKIFASCGPLFEELRLYRRDAEHGRIVKKNDHLCDALRYLIFSGLKRMITEPVEEKNTGSRNRVLDGRSDQGWMTS